MPIRINLLAEAQAAAELRRKDPVKRGIWLGSFLVCVVLLWIANLQWDISYETHKYNNLESEWTGNMTKYSAVTNQQIRIRDVDHKLQELDTLSTNRFLWGPVLNALQKTMVDQVQVTKLRSEDNLIKEDGHYVGSGSTKKLIPGAVIEKISLSIEAKDLKPSEQHYTRFKEALGSYEFFAKALGRRDGFVMDGILGPLTVDPVDPNKQFVTFTLTAHFPEVRRNE